MTNNNKTTALQQMREALREPIGSFVDWNSWIEKLFCGVENLRILCLTCHKAKTANERTQNPRAKRAPAGQRRED